MDACKYSNGPTFPTNFMLCRLKCYCFDDFANQLPNIYKSMVLNFIHAEHIHIVTVWIQIISASTFFELRFSLFFFFFFGSAAIVDFVNCKQCIRALFTVPQITLFSHFFIKNGSHSTIYIFKNYFATVFSVSVFSFSKNKLNPNTPIYTPWFFFQNFGGAMAP